MVYLKRCYKATIHGITQKFLRKIENIEYTKLCGESLSLNVNDLDCLAAAADDGNTFEVIGWFLFVFTFGFAELYSV